MPRESNDSFGVGHQRNRVVRASVFAILVPVLALAGCGSPRGTAPKVASSATQAPVPARTSQRVLVVTENDVLLEAALLVVADVDPHKLTPAEYERDPRVAENMDVVIFDEYTPTALPPPPTNLLFFHPTGPNSPIRIRGDVSHPSVTKIDEAHPVMRWVAMSEVRIETSSVYAPEATRGESTIAYSNADSIIAAKRDGQRKIVAFGFSLASTDLALRVAFPMLLANTLGWFAGD